MADPHDDDELDARAEDLTDELAKKYDPDRLLQIVSRRAGRGESLEHSVRARYEKKLGVDLSHVRLYSGEFAEEFNRQRNAYAVTVGGTGMVLMGGSPVKAAGSTAGQALLAHELTHVAQASRGLHRKGYGAGMPFAEEHEAEAEAVESSVAAEQGGGSSGISDHEAKQQAQAEHEATVEAIKQRVIQLVGEAVIVRALRNGAT